MEHLSKVQERHTEAVTVIGVSDEALSRTVAFLVAESAEAGRLQNDRVRYSFATDPDRSVHTDYLVAAGLSGLPEAFIIGRDGRIEWIGHPMDIDPPLDAVVGGTWDRAAHIDAFRKRSVASRDLRAARRRLTGAIENERWEAAAAAVDAVVAALQQLGHAPDGYPATKYSILLSRLGDRQRAVAYGKRIRDDAWDDNPTQLARLAWSTLGTDDYPVAPENRDLAFALEVIRRAVHLAPGEYDPLLMLAKVRAARGETAAAVAAHRHAIDAFEALRPRIAAHELSRYEADLQTMREELADMSG
jgi:hypothetical protein